MDHLDDIINLELMSSTEIDTFLSEYSWEYREKKWLYKGIFEYFGWHSKISGERTNLVLNIIMEKNGAQDIYYADIS